jgi:hypothetical protein
MRVRLQLWLTAVFPVLQRWVDLAPACCGTCPTCLGTAATGMTTTWLGSLRRER